MSNIFVWNIYEKSFTPYWASIAPKHQCHPHQMVTKPTNVSRLMNDTKMKRMFKFLKKYVLTRPYWFHLGVILCKSKKLSFNIKFFSCHWMGARRESCFYWCL
jgi:hypothetical protein